ncbi:MAG: sulfite exporter TauE/SafE family protein [Deinococcota bacterium]
MLEPSLLFALAIIFAAMLVRSVAGFGDVIVALPLLTTLLGLNDAVALMALLGLTSSLTLALSSWHDINWRAIRPYLLASCMGVPLGLLVLQHAPEAWLLGILGVLISLFGVYNLIVPKASTQSASSTSGSSTSGSSPAWLTYPLGLFGGILGSAYGVLGPPVVLYSSLQGWSPAMFRATLQGYFVLTFVFIVGGHSLAGLWNQQVWSLYVLSLPLVGIAAYVGTRITQRLTAAYFERLVYAGITILGIMLIF